MPWSCFGRHLGPNGPGTHLKDGMKNASEIYIGANLFGFLLYAVFIMRIQYEMHAEQRHYGDFGDSMTLL